MAEKTSYNTWSIIKQVGTSSRGNIYEAECECGNVVDRTKGDLRRTKSCGCFRREYMRNKSTKHGDRGTRFYNIWAGIITRCTNKNHKSYKMYGEKGITVHDKWREYLGFKEDMLSFYEDGLVIDRINNKKGYSRSNCRWVTPKENSRNRSVTKMASYNGVMRPLAEWCEKLSLNYDKAKYRVNKGSIEINQVMKEIK